MVSLGQSAEVSGVGWVLLGFYRFCDIATSFMLARPGLWAMREPRARDSKIGGEVEHGGVARPAITGRSCSDARQPTGCVIHLKKA